MGICEPSFATAVRKGRVTVIEQWNGVVRGMHQTPAELWLCLEPDGYCRMHLTDLLQRSLLPAQDLVKEMENALPPVA